MAQLAKTLAGHSCAGVSAVFFSLFTWILGLELISSDLQVISQVPEQVS